MASFKIVISDPKTRRAYQKDADQAASGLLGKKLGEKVTGGPLGLDGYTIEITGGSDKEGFPMRRDVEGVARKRLLLSHPPGFHPAKKGQRSRKSVRGNTISGDTTQINAKVLEHGKKTIEEAWGVKPKEKEGKKEEVKEEKKEKAEIKEPEKMEKKEAKPAAEPGQEAAEKKMGVKKLEG